MAQATKVVGVMDWISLDVRDGDTRQQARCILELYGYQIAESSTPNDVAFVVSDGPFNGTTPHLLLGENLLPSNDSGIAVPWPTDVATLSSALARLQAVSRKQAVASAGGEAGPSLADVAPDLIGVDETMDSVRQRMAKVASMATTVLVTGESGTGKEIVARGIHAASRRSSGPFVPVNCGAIPTELLESELFGHEKGAFTGAVARKLGRFELATGGTLFLDEVGELPLQMQVKLLRVLQDRTFERVGGTVTQHVDIRLVAATHQSLENKIEEGAFREDLFYRLNVFPILLPPLRARAGDIRLLANHFAGRHAGKSVLFTEQALDCLDAYSWPGNVRELANLVERVAIETGGGWVDVGDLPRRIRGDASVSSFAASKEAETDESFRLPVNGLDLKDYLASLEQSLIRQALEDTGEVVARAADKLHIRRTTLVEKMRKYGMQRVS